jgi:hypothetical protein
MTWPAHPDDEWVEVTGFGDAEPRYALARSGVGTKISRARAQYLAGQIDAAEYEQAVDDVIAETVERPGA